MKPEPVELPNLSVAAVDAKTFAADIVNPKPEPVEVSVSESDSEILVKFVTDPKVTAALAAEGLEIDQEAVATVLAENEQRAKVRAEADFSFEPIPEPVELHETIELVDVTPEAFRNLKEEINASFSELAALVLDQQGQISAIEARLTEHNKRGGHKI